MKKRRKKAITKKDGPEIEADYYQQVNLVKEAMKHPRFTERMTAWDHELCKDRHSRDAGPDGVTAANRVSTMHAIMENTNSSGCTATNDFFRSNLFLSFLELSSLDSSPSGNDATVDAKLLTQPESTAV
jgi:hypothetical protein